MIAPENRKRVRLGDIIEVKVKGGFAYAQYTHEHKVGAGMGSLIRVFDNIYAKRPESLEEIVEQPERFSVFFPVSVAVWRGIFPLMGNVDIPPKLQEFPTFRIGLENLETGEVAWKLTDGKKGLASEEAQC